MLVAKLDFQVTDGFAVALETKVARLDDAGVYGAHGDLVNARPLYAKKRMRVCARPVLAGPRLEIGMLPQRLRPRMPFRMHAMVLKQFAFERLCLRELRRKCWVTSAVGDLGAYEAQTSPGIVSHHREHLLSLFRISIPRRQCAERGEPSALGANVNADPLEHCRKNLGHVPKLHCKTVLAPQRSRMAGLCLAGPAYVVACRLGHESASQHASSLTKRVRH